MQLQLGDRVRSKVFQPGICEEHEEGKIVDLISRYLAIVEFCSNSRIAIQTELLERIQ